MVRSAKYGLCASVVTSATVMERRKRRLAARRSYTYPSRVIASRTRSFVDADTRGLSCKTSETVARDTPQAAATSFRVIRFFNCSMSVRRDDQDHGRGMSDVSRRCSWSLRWPLHRPIEGDSQGGKHIDVGSRPDGRSPPVGKSSADATDHENVSW